MRLQEFITTYSGKIIGDGECGTLVRQYWNDVAGISPPSYPSAKDYWFDAVPEYTHTTTPNVGAIAVYDAHGAYPDGHIAIYIGNGQVFEQNADPDGSPAHTFTRANTYLLGYLTLGDTMTAAEQAELADALTYKAQVTSSNAWADPNGFSDDVSRVAPHINNLMADRAAVASALGLPVISDAATLTAAITALKSNGVSSVIINGVKYTPEA